MGLTVFVKMLNMDTQNEVHVHVYVINRLLASSHAFVYFHYCVVACGSSFVFPYVGHMVPLLSVGYTIYII